MSGVSSTIRILVISFSLLKVPSASGLSCWNRACESVLFVCCGCHILKAGLFRKHRSCLAIT